MMTSKILEHHRQKSAYIYLRQSTMGQVRHHQESTERQYALKDRALALGWDPQQICILDRDLGVSGTQMAGRDDFKSLVADVLLGKVGAVFALEASRLARSCADWHRLLELCSFTNTLIIDEDGCYNPSDFNDQLLLGIKGTMSQAELHLIRARLQGGKANKAKRGELRHPLPVGFCYDEEGFTITEPDEEVYGAVRLLFDTFRELGTAYGVVHRFASLNLKFPKRQYGGIWNGRLIWGQLTHNRVLDILKNPCYAGAYVYGRYHYKKMLSPEGDFESKVKKLPMDSWEVNIRDHHPGYITWEEFLSNQGKLKDNQTNGEEMLLAGPAREGLALLQGLLLCSNCGRKLSIRYKGNNGIYPTYDCNWLRREGLSSTSCLSVRCDLLDNAISKRLLEVLKPNHIEIALKALQELEMRDNVVIRQWQMKVERAEYETQLAQRRYEQVDPSNRLVASNLERRWNDSLVKLEEVKKQYAEQHIKKALVVTQEQKEKLVALAKDFPRLWNLPSTKAKDKKNMLRLLIKDITVEKLSGLKKVILHIRWQGGAMEDLSIDIPLNIYDRQRYSKEMVEIVREIAQDKTDKEIIDLLNKEGRKSASGKPFTLSMIKWIRHHYNIPSPQLKRPEELTVKQAAEKFGVSTHVVYYWIERGMLNARKLNAGSPHWITITDEKEKTLREWVRNSSRIQKRSTSLNRMSTN